MKTTVADIANFLLTDYSGENYNICEAVTLSALKDGSLSFFKNKSLKLKDAQALILVPLDFQCTDILRCSFIKVENPRLAFAKVVNEFFYSKAHAGVHKTLIIGHGCDIDNSVSIGANCVIGSSVSIGSGTVINNNVVLYDNTIVGNNCYIKSGAIIGEDGFGFEFEKNGLPVRIPHIGNVVIENDVEIGSNTVIARGTLESTKIGQSVKIDDQVFIAHNCIISFNTVITACAEINGSVIVGSNCWIGPNSSIMQKVVIGDNATIGIGAVITKNVESNKKIMGLNSLEIRKIALVKKRIKYGE